MKSISIDDYYLIKDNSDVFSIDVRTNNEYKILKNFPWAVNIELNELFANYEKYLPNKNQTIITICNAGNRSSEAAMFLQEHGYKNAFVLNSGIYGFYRKYE
ncbi:rhodanese-like domain-containing protein [Spiroplasma endosymbiont of Labia minor]|uniref:rhodanese-like domain-containing protein n=1 Tax=Spiroplasma endosymbiont of Labia minor TaxID=3066305 RepID=UPI0030CEFA50